MYKLKPGIESFEVVDGAFAGKRFLRGKVYEKIPPEEKDRFEQVKAQSAAHSSKQGSSKLKAQSSKQTKPKTETEGP